MFVSVGRLLIIICSFMLDVSVYVPCTTSIRFTYSKNKFIASYVLLKQDVNVKSQQLYYTEEHLHLKCSSRLINVRFFCKGAFKVLYAKLKIQTRKRICFKWTRHCFQKTELLKAFYYFIEALLLAGSHLHSVEAGTWPLIPVSGGSSLSLLYNLTFI